MWTRLSTGIYLTHVLQPDWRSLAWAGVFMGGHDSAVSGRAALKLHGLVDKEPTPIAVLHPYSSNPRPDSGWWTFTRTRVPFRTTGELPRVRVERAVLDLCAEEPGRAVHWVTQAIGGRRTTAKALHSALDEMPRHPIRKELELLLTDAGQGAESPLELVYLRDVERAHGITPGKRQFRSGGYRCDVRYGEGLIVELDGRRGHEGVGSFRDMDRDNYHMVRGAVTLRYGWQQCIEHPCAVATQVAEVRQQLGWRGMPRKCTNCRRVM